MKKLGECLTDKELEDMMKQADVDGDGKINYEGTRTIKYYNQVHRRMRLLTVLFQLNFPSPSQEDRKN